MIENFTIILFCHVQASEKGIVICFLIDYTMNDVIYFYYQIKLGPMERLYSIEE